MAVAVKVIKKAKELNEYAVIADITFDATYPTGGYLVTPQQFGLQSLDFILLNNPGGYGYWYDNVNKKLKVLAGNANPMPELANNTDLHTITARVVAYGI